MSYKKGAINVALLVLGILLLGGGALYSSLSEDRGTDTRLLSAWRQGKDGQAEQDSAQKEWNEIIVSRLSGLESDLPIEKLEEIKLAPDCQYQEPYLRREGGLCPVVWGLSVLITDQIDPVRDSGRSRARPISNGVEIIDSQDKLKETFAPVKSEDEAMSFVAVTQNDLKVINGVLEGETSTDEEGNYLVKVIKKNTFGCSAHNQTDALYKVTPVGDIELVYHTPPDPGGLCVD